jgi:hypothetical protein
LGHIQSGYREEDTVKKVYDLSCRGALRKMYNIQASKLSIKDDNEELEEMSTLEKKRKLCRVVRYYGNKTNETDKTPSPLDHN